MNVIAPVLIIVVLIIALVLAGGVLVVLGMVIASIHGEERRMSLAGVSRTRTRTLARRVLGVHTAQPGRARCAHHEARR